MRGGELFHIQKIRALEVSVALATTGFDRGSLAGGLDASIRQLGFIEGQHSRNFGQMAFYVGDHHVLDFEFRDGVG